MSCRKNIVLGLLLIILISIFYLIPKELFSFSFSKTEQSIISVKYHEKRLYSDQFYGKVYPKINNPVFIDDKKINRIRAQINNKEEPTYSEWIKLLNSANSKLDYTPQPPVDFFVPYVYINPEGHSKSKDPLVKDANNAYELALAYQITGDSQYAQSAIRIINAWSNNVNTIRDEEDTPLVISSNFPSMIVAASLLESSSKWEQKDRVRFKQFLSDKILPNHTMNLQNNWGNWGLLLVISTATYLNDQKLFLKSIDRWKFFIDHQMNELGHLKYEVTRNNGKGNYGIWYSHFSMQPQTLSAEIAKVNGVYLFDYVSKEGKSLEGAFNNLVKWTNEPQTFPYHKGKVDEMKHIRKKMNENSINGDYPASISYFEILAAYYNNQTAKRIVFEERPLTANVSFPYLTFTHGGANRID
ncbi:hypothetical protein J2Y03_003913 [Neobacillus niacini]|uniref:alginate lyase family protein n=1 Tax=Neobacillus niacini TaxID=86668 RepID=UPI002864FB0F|nr:alginate lyase family protein [Neobacillus niacini]MDR7078856.1 hypothetical protein [Neobacillus niacini]